MSPAVLRLRSTLIALVGIAAITVVCYRLVHVSATAAAIALLLGVLLAGVYGRKAEAVIASFAATLSLDYFFVPPVGSISIGNPDGWISLIAFLAVALVATNLSGRLRLQRDQLMERQLESEKLHALNRAMLFSGGEDVRRLIVNKCTELFNFSEVALFEEPLEPNVEKTWTLVPVVLGNKNFGSFAFRGASPPETTLQALGNTIAVALAQAQAQEAGSRAEAVRKGEELKSMMIDALAHDLKTPLTAIEAAGEMLLHGTDVRPQQRQDLLEVIQQEAQGLRRLVNEAIHLARIDANRLKLERHASTVRELIGTAVQSISERSSSRQIQIEVPDDMPPVSVDSDLMVQALKQLLDNAMKYSPSRSPVLVSAQAGNGFVSIEVRDQGQGLTELEQRHVFDKFYRGRHDRSAVQGTGMGLAITKEIVEAHGGSASVESQVGHGSRFTIALPVATFPVEVGRTHA